MFKWVLVVVIITALVAVMKSLFNNKVGDVDLTYGRVYNSKNIRNIKKDSRNAGKCNSPFIKEMIISQKIEEGVDIINSDKIILFKEGNNYDEKPKW